MKFELYTDVVLTRDVPEENLQVDDIGTVVEIHNITGMEIGYSVEIFDLLGDTVTIITVPQSWLRRPTHEDQPAARKKLEV